MPQIQQYNAQIAERGVAQGRSVTASDMGGGAGEAMSQFGASSAKLSNQYADKIDQVEQRKGKLEAEKLYSDFRIKMAQENRALQDQATGTEDFTVQSLALYDKASGEFDKLVGDNQYAREHLQQRIIAGRDEFAIHNIGFEAALKAKKQQQDYEGIVNNYQNLVIADPSQYNQVKGEIRKTSELLNINPVVREELVRKNQESLAATAWNAIPEDSRAQLLAKGKPQGGFDSAIKTVMQNEGGYVAIDGSSGAPAIFGINGKWHPEAYAKAKDIADSKGIDAGKAYAVEFYKKEFWDKYNISSLPANVQTIVMDGVINHSSAFAGKLVDAAHSESPDALIAMRLGEYRRLAEKAPEKYGASLGGWENRLKAVAAERDVPIFSDLSPEMKVRALNQAQDNIRRDAKMKIEDPAAWGMKNGLSIDQIAAAQQNRQTASVMPKEMAVQTVERLKNSQHPEEIIQFAHDLKQQYGEYAPNAVHDMKRAKMPDEYEAMMSLALDNPVKNSEAISLLMDVAKAGNKGLDEAYKSTVSTGMFTKIPADPKKLEDSTVAASSPSISAMLNEGYSFDEINRNINIASSLAKAYQIKNPGADIDKAVSFALQPTKDNYKFAELNGVKYRVPAKYDVDAVQGRLSQFYNAMEFSTGEGDIGSKASASLKEKAIPFLNAHKDGIRFRAPNGEILLDKSGNPAELNFDAIISSETPQEKLQRQNRQKPITNYLLPTGGM